MTFSARPASDVSLYLACISSPVSYIVLIAWSRDNSILAPVTKHLLDTRVARIYEGTDEIMELKIASTVLGREFEAYK